jgi:hypothetical protein
MYARVLGGRLFQRRKPERYLIHILHMFLGFDAASAHFIRHVFP